jgi:exoribonuclease R
MNYLCALEFQHYKKGIFRSIKMKNKAFDMPTHLPHDFQQFLRGWNSNGGHYLKYENHTEHEFLELDAYVHITSPIRRLVDLLNIVELQHLKGIYEFNNESRAFYDKWICDESLEYINVCMRAIRKLQNKCQLLDLCVNHPGVMDKEYDGYVFDKIQRNDGLYQYLVYIPELKLLNKYTSRQNHENYQANKYRLYLFKDETTFKQKIMLGWE